MPNHSIGDPISTRSLGGIQGHDVKLKFRHGKWRPHGNSICNREDSIRDAQEIQKGNVLHRRARGAAELAPSSLILLDDVTLDNVAVTVAVAVAVAVADG